MNPDIPQLSNKENDILTKKFTVEEVYEDKDRTS
jgi:hypothetical protein